MNPPTFQTDRSEALRRQLVNLPTGTATASVAASSTAAVSLEPQHKRRAGRIVLVAAAACLGLLGIGQTSVFMQTAHAAGVLNTVADRVSSFQDPQPAPGEYLLISTDGNWMGGGITEDGQEWREMTEQKIDVYVPGDPSEEWVLDREWGAMGPIPAHEETISAHDGEFYELPWTVPFTADDIANLPRDGQALYDYFNSTYQGGSASRDENNFVRITDLLRTGLVPADLRAGLYEALALIPGVTASENQANLNGITGTAIGRTEPLRAGERDEIIIDPDSGLIIGERTLMTYAAFGFGANEITGHTAIEYRIVDTATVPTR